jgi:hypothetical protein
LRVKVRRLLILCVTFLAALVFTTHAFAIDKTWDHGAGTDSFGDPANWDPDGVPGPDDLVFLDEVGDAPVLQSGQAHTIDGLRLTQGALTVNGALTIDGGSLSTMARSVSLGPFATVTSAGHLTLGQGALFAVGLGSAVVNAGHLVVESTVDNSFVLGAGLIDNRGTIFNLGGTHVLPFLVNAGIVMVEGGRLAVDNLAPSAGSWVLPAGATLQFQSGDHALLSGASITGAGSFVVHSGKTTIPTGANVTPSTLTIAAQGELRAAPSIVSTVTNDGVLAPEARLSIFGTYTQTTNGRLQLDITDQATFDRLLVTAGSSLGGTLEIMRHPFFVPPAGVELRVVEGSAVSGVFAAISGGQISPTHSLVADYGSNYVRLVSTVAAQPPPPPPPASRPPPSVVRCVVPNVRGKTLTQARRVLAARRCRLGRVTRAFSAKVKRGRVVAQHRRPGARLPRNTQVSVTLSKGKRRK